MSWFAEMRWLVSVLRDAAAGSRPEIGTGPSTPLPDASEYLVGLIALYDAGEVLLGTLARQDAESAVEIAEQSRQPELMSVVAGVADDFSVLVGIVARCEAGVMEWKQALIHVAIRQQNIAKMLAAVSGEFSATGGGTRGGGWESSFLTKDSVYGGCSMMSLVGRWTLRIMLTHSSSMK